MSFIDLSDNIGSSCQIIGKESCYKVINSYLFKVSILKLMETIPSQDDSESILKRKRRIHSRTKAQRNQQLYQEGFQEMGINISNILNLDSFTEEGLIAFYFEVNSRTLDITYKVGNVNNIS